MTIQAAVRMIHTCQLMQLNWQNLCIDSVNLWYIITTCTKRNSSSAKWVSWFPHELLASDKPTSCGCPPLSAAPYRPVLFHPAFYECKITRERKLISNKCLDRVAFVLAWARGFAYLPGVVLCEPPPPPSRPRALGQGARWKASGGPSKDPLRCGHEQDRGPQCGPVKLDTLWQQLHTAHSRPCWQPRSQEIRSSLIHFYRLTTCSPRWGEREREHPAKSIYLHVHLVSFSSSV